MESSFETVYRATRRQYEVGRFFVAIRHAAMAAVLVGLGAGLTLGTAALAWLPLTFLTVTLTEWRGVHLMKGTRRGLVAGFASMLLPLSVLRPCCGIDAKALGTTCCVMPFACWGTGALIGLGMALLLPNASREHRLESAAGMILGVTAVAITRCSMLFLGEAVGLLGGIAAGVAAMSAARAWANRPRPAV